MKGANTYERNSCKQTRSQKQDVCWRTDQHWSDDSDSDCHVLYTFGILPYIGAFHFPDDDPVAIGAMIIGPKAGLWLGLVFGATSFYQVLTAPSAFTSALFSISPLYTFLVCVPTRALMGWLTGVLFQLIHKVDRTNTFSYFAGGFLAAFLNTLFFMGTLVLLFWNTDYIQGLNQTFGNVNPLVFVVLFVGVNGALEMPASCVAGGIVSKALSKAVHKKRA